MKQMLTTLKLQMIWMISSKTNVRVGELALVKPGADGSGIRSV
jgi:hypothetical protein